MLENITGEKRTKVTMAARTMQTDRMVRVDIVFAQVCFEGIFVASERVWERRMRMPDGVKGYDVSGIRSDIT